MMTLNSVTFGNPDVYSISLHFTSLHFMIDGSYKSSMYYEGRLVEFQPELDIEATLHAMVAMPLSRTQKTYGEQYRDWDVIVDITDAFGDALTRILPSWSEIGLRWRIRNDTRYVIIATNTTSQCILFTDFDGQIWIDAGTTGLKSFTISFLRGLTVGLHPQTEDEARRWSGLPVFPEADMTISVMPLKAFFEQCLVKG